MSFLSNYISSVIDYPIKDYMYIERDNITNMVQRYESSMDTINIIELDFEVVLEDFLLYYKEFIGMYSNNQTFITYGHNKFESSSQLNYNYIGVDFCTCTFLPTDNISPIKFLVNHIPPYSDLLYFDFTPFHDFNFPTAPMMLKKFSEINENFENETVVKLYKKYNNYYIF